MTNWSVDSDIPLPGDYVQGDVLLRFLQNVMGEDGDSPIVTKICITTVTGHDFEFDIMTEVEKLEPS